MSPRQQQDTDLHDPLLPIEEEPASSVLVDDHAWPSSPASLRKKRNVKLTLIYTALAFSGRSIWSQSVLATFVYLLRDNNPAQVGYLTAVMGLSQLIASFPAGYVSDVYSRAALLKFASVVGVSAVATTLAACYFLQSYVWLVVALAAWGACYGVANTSLAALFADSVETGERSHYFTQRSILVTLGNTMGPSCSLALFAVLGNDWTLRDCALVMCVGQVVCFPALILLCFFQDNGDDLNSVQEVAEEEDEVEETGIAVEVDREGHTAMDKLHSERSFRDTEDLIRNLEEDIGQLSNLITERQVSREVITAQDCASTASSHNVNNDTINLICNGCCLPRNRVIPILIAVADLISGLGSGMSIRYFPLFFLNQLKLNPVQVQAIYVAAPMVQVVLMKLSQRLAKRYGRCHVTVAFKWTGILLMVSMITAYSVLHANVGVVCLIFVLRTGFMNSCSALTKSMLMDNVPSHERGKWSALESVNMFSWSGSAALGGVLVGFVGIVPLFIITAGIQLLSSLVVMTLFGVDTKE